MNVLLWVLFCVTYVICLSPPFWSLLSSYTYLLHSSWKLVFLGRVLFYIWCPLLHHSALHLFFVFCLHLSLPVWPWLLLPLPVKFLVILLLCQPLLCFHSLFFQYLLWYCIPFYFWLHVILLALYEDNTNASFIYIFIVCIWMNKFTVYALAYIYMVALRECGLRAKYMWPYWLVCCIHGCQMCTVYTVFRDIIWTIMFFVVYIWHLKGIFVVGTHMAIVFLVLFFLLNYMQTYVGYVCTIQQQCTGAQMFNLTGIFLWGQLRIMWSVCKSVLLVTLLISFSSCEAYIYWRICLISPHELICICGISVAF